MIVMRHLKAISTFYATGSILECRGQGVRHNVKRVRQYVRQLLLSHSNINTLTIRANTVQRRFGKELSDFSVSFKYLKVTL
jgi:hypothetical protein